MRTHPFWGHVNCMVLWKRAAVIDKKVLQKQSAVTDHFSSEQLLLFALANLTLVVIE